VRKKPLRARSVTNFPRGGCAPMPIRNFSSRPSLATHPAARPRPHASLDARHTPSAAGKGTQIPQILKARDDERRPDSSCVSGRRRMGSRRMGARAAQAAPRGEVSRPPGGLFDPPRPPKRRRRRGRPSQNAEGGATTRPTGLDVWPLGPSSDRIPLQNPSGVRQIGPAEAMRHSPTISASASGPAGGGGTPPSGKRPFEQHLARARDTRMDSFSAKARAPLPPARAPSTLDDQRPGRRRTAGHDLSRGHERLNLGGNIQSAPPREQIGAPMVS